MAAIQQKINSLEILPMNKTVVFYSPVEGKSVLVRTGTIEDGNSFYHSLLHAYSKDYVKMKRNKRTVFTSRLKKSLANKLNKGRWENICDGLTANMPFQENVQTNIKHLYKYLTQKKDKPGKTKSIREVIKKCIKSDDDKEMFQMFFDALSLEKIERKIIPVISDKCSDKTVSECKKLFINEIVSSFSIVLKQIKKDAGLRTKQIKFYLEEMINIITEICRVSEQDAFNDYVENIGNTSIFVDNYTVGVISERFNRDIYFIDSKTRMPYKFENHYGINKRKSIIVLWTGGSHYEIVGRLLHGNSVQREFDFEDPLIQTIYTYLQHPENVAKKYPKLIPYLPKEIREKEGVDISESSEEREKDFLEGSERENESVNSMDSSYEKSESNDSSYEDSDSDSD